MTRSNRSNRKSHQMVVTKAVANALSVAAASIIKEVLTLGFPRLAFHYRLV